MPHAKSAVKRLRQNAKIRERNRAARSAFRAAVKEAEKAIESGNGDSATTAVRRALRIIGKTEKKGLIHRNKAARHASHLQKRLNSIGKAAA